MVWKVDQEEQVLARFLQLRRLVAHCPWRGADDVVVAFFLLVEVMEVHLHQQEDLCFSSCICRCVVEAQSTLIARARSLVSRAGNRQMICNTNF